MVAETLAAEYVLNCVEYCVEYRLQVECVKYEGRSESKERFAIQRY